MQRQTLGPNGFSTCEALRSEGFAVPGTTGVFVEGTPKVGVFLHPSLNESGKLETVLLRAIAGEPVMQCVDGFMDCIKKVQKMPLRNEEKSRVQAFLATRDKPGLTIGIAAENNYFNFAHPAHAALKAFLQAL